MITKKKITISKKIKESVFRLMERVMEDMKLGIPQVIIIKLIESLILISFSFHNKVTFYIITSLIFLGIHQIYMKML